jgi:hypothetical protein
MEVVHMGGDIIVVSEMLGILGCAPFSTNGATIIVEHAHCGVDVI